MLVVQYRKNIFDFMHRTGRQFMPFGKMVNSSSLNDNIRKGDKFKFSIEGETNATFYSLQTENFKHKCNKYAEELSKAKKYLGAA